MKTPGRILLLLVELLVFVAILLAGWWRAGALGLLLGVLLVLMLTLILGIILFAVGLLRKTPAYLPYSNAETPRERRARFTRWIREKQAALNRYYCEEWEQTAGDGILLRGIFVAGQPGEKGVVMLLHGFRCSGLYMADYAEYYRQTYGYSVLLPDARAHGKSGGDYVGMGWLERLDGLLWLQRIIERVGEDAKIIVHGISMGGATAMMMCGEKLPPQVRFVVEDCGYTSVRDELAWQLNTRYHVPLFPSLYAGNVVCRLVAGYGFWEASSVEQLEKATLPMLFIHGEKDAFVPYYMSALLLEASAAPQKELVSVPGARHLEAWVKDTEGNIKNALDRYIKSYML